MLFRSLRGNFGSNVSLRVALAGLFIMIVVWLQAASEETRVYSARLHAQGQFTIYNNFVREDLIEAGLLPDGFSADLQCKGEVWAQVFAPLVGKVVGVLLLQSSFADNPMAILSRQQQTVKRFWFGSQGGRLRTSRSAMWLLHARLNLKLRDRSFLINLARAYSGKRPLSV